MEQVEHETTEAQMRAYSAMAVAQAEWEQDPTVWQRLDEPTPYGDDSVDRMGQYADPDFLVEFPTVAEAMLELPRYAGMSPLFGRHLRAMVLSRQAQMAPGRVHAVTREEFGRMRPVQQLRDAQRLQSMADEVFAWMGRQGLEPFPGRLELPRLVSEQTREQLLPAQD